MPFAKVAHNPAVSLLKAMEQKSKNMIVDGTLVLADQATKAIAQAAQVWRNGGR
jgi:hypothetical protein